LLTADEARRHRWRNVITNALGATATFRLDVLHFEVRPGDRILLLSDGVSMLLSETMLRQVVTEAEPEEAARQLIAEANDRGAPDNVTAVEVRAVEPRPKRYSLPEAAAGSESVDISDTMSGIRRIEDEYPATGPLGKMRRHPWYPYRIWILGSLYLLLLFLLFSLWRG
jgi:protein phosphatase